MLTVTELSRSQMEEIKQAYLLQYFEECEDRCPSYNELANVDEIISDERMLEVYSGTVFSPDDFFCGTEEAI